MWTTRRQVLIGTSFCRLPCTRRKLFGRPPFLYGQTLNRFASAEPAALCCSFSFTPYMEQPKIYEISLFFIIIIFWVQNANRIVARHVLTVLRHALSCMVYMTSIFTLQSGVLVKQICSIWVWQQQVYLTINIESICMLTKSTRSTNDKIKHYCWVTRSITTPTLSGRRNLWNNILYIAIRVTPNHTLGMIELFALSSGPQNIDTQQRKRQYSLTNVITLT